MKHCRCFHWGLTGVPILPVLGKYIGTEPLLKEYCRLVMMLLCMPPFRSSPHEALIDSGGSNTECALFSFKFTLLLVKIDDAGLG